MPKRVDHAERRTEIAEALVRVAGRSGLHAVGMRDVAAEAAPGHGAQPRTASRIEQMPSSLRHMRHSLRCER